MEALQLLFLEKENSIDINQSYINQLFKSVRSVTSYSKAVEEIDEFSPDIIIVDLELKGKFDGFDAAEQLFEQYGIPYIFCSLANMDQSMSDLISGSNALGFLKKPFSIEDLKLSLTLSLNNFERQLSLKKQINRMRALFQIRDNEPYIFIRTDYQLKKINLNSISYVEAVKDYVHIFCGDKFYSTHATMKQMEHMLPDHLFIRIHRSYIVRLDKIELIKYPILQLEDQEKKLNIGGLYRKELLKKLPII